jgi:hypothetical protein
VAVPTIGRTEGGCTQERRFAGRVTTGLHGTAGREVDYTGIPFIQDSALPATFP